MGTHLVNILHTREDTMCTVTTRSSQRLSYDNIRYVTGNAHDTSFLYPLLESLRWDAIVDFMIYNTADFAERLSRFLSVTSQYIYISSSRVYAQSDAPLTEESPRLLDVCEDREYLSTDEYALAKARQEDLLRCSGRRNWTIVRPYVTFSESRLQLSPLEKEFWLYRALHGRTIVFSKDLADRITTLTYGADVARGIAALIGRNEAFGEIFHITGNSHYKWNEILDLYLDVIENTTGSRPKVLMEERYSSYIGGSAQQIRFDRLYDRVFDNSKIGKFIDVESFKDTKEALSECLKYFISHPDFKSINWVSEARKDRVTREWASMFEIKGTKNKIKYFLLKSNMIK